MTSGSLQIRKGLLGQLPLPQSPTGRCLLLTDQNVEALLPGSWGSLPRHVIPAGEQSKSWSELEGCLLAMDRAGLDRDGLLIAVGGGVVTDLGGLAASLHRRGIAWHAIPTSLIGQVDAAIGGKTAINLGGGKNTVGTVHLPAQVLIDPVTLATLPRRHLLSGMAEVLKTALIAGQSQTEQALRLGPDDFAQASDAAVAQIQASVATKQALVKVDLYDQGPRRKLNLGHTFGHALEALSLGSMTHGEAVGLGLLCAARIAAASDLENTLRQTLVRWGLPTVAPTPAAELATQLARDKKRSGQLLTIVELHAPGQVTLRGGVDEATVLKAFAAVT